MEQHVSKNGQDKEAPAKGSGKRGDGKIRVAIVGVGNCASSLVQGRYYYENAKDDEFVPGLMHVNLGGYHIRDIEFVAAFDIDKNKVGKDLSEAIYTKPNNTYVFQQVPHIGVKVERGMTHDGLGKYLSQIIEKAPGPTADVVGILKERKVDVVVSYLPVGSEEATKWYVEQALEAGVGFVNAIPVFIGREPYWQRRFAEKGLPVIGDDIKSQVGATITHRVLTRLFMDRGVRLDRTYQLNFGGNTDFLNMLERERLESKKISKTNAVTSMLDYDIDPDDIHVGPSDHVPWLLDRKWCYIRMEGTTFGDVPLNAELKLEVWDSPNSAGVIIDAVRCLKLGLDRGLKGTLVAPSLVLHEEPADPDPRRHRLRAGRGLHPRRGQRDPGGHRGRARASHAPDGPGASQGERGGTLKRRAAGPGAASPPPPAPVASTTVPAPHRPPVRGGRVRRTLLRANEKATVTAYRATSALMGHVPVGVAWPVARAGFLVGYAAWPAKRRIIQANAAPHPGRAARRPRRAPTGASGLPDVRALRRRADAPAIAAARRAGPALRDRRTWRLRLIPGPVRADGRGGPLAHRGELPHRQHRDPGWPPSRRGACPSTAWPTTAPTRSSTSSSRRSGAAGASRSSRGATCARCSASCATRSCSACSSTGAIAPRTCRSASSGHGRRSRPGRPCSRRGPARCSCRSPADGFPTGTTRPSTCDPIEVVRRVARRRGARHPGHRRRGRGHGPRGTRPVVHVQAHVAGDGSRGARRWRRGPPRCPPCRPRRRPRWRPPGRRRHERAAARSRTGPGRDGHAAPAPHRTARGGRRRAGLPPARRAPGARRRRARRRALPRRRRGAARPRAGQHAARLRGPRGGWAGHATRRPRRRGTHASWTSWSAASSAITPGTWWS